MDPENSIFERQVTGGLSQKGRVQFSELPLKAMLSIDPAESHEMTLSEG